VQDVAAKYHSKISIADKIALWDVGVPSFCLGDVLIQAAMVSPSKLRMHLLMPNVMLVILMAEIVASIQIDKRLVFLLLNFVYTQSRTIIELMFFYFCNLAN